MINVSTFTCLLLSELELLNNLCFFSHFQPHWQHGLTAMQILRVTVPGNSSVRGVRTRTRYYCSYRSMWNQPIRTCHTILSVLTASTAVSHFTIINGIEIAMINMINHPRGIRTRISDNSDNSIWTSVYIEYGQSEITIWPIPLLCCVCNLL